MIRDILQIIISVTIIMRAIPSSREKMKTIVNRYITHNPQIWSGIIFLGTLLGLLIGIMFFLALSGICPSGGSIGSSVHCTIHGEIFEILAQWGYFLILMSAFVLLTPVIGHLGIIGFTGYYRYDQYVKENKKNIVIYGGIIISILSLLLFLINIFFLIKGL